MILEFKVYKLREDSRMYKKLITDLNKINKLNEFIIVGEESLGEDFDCYKVQQLETNGITLIGGLLFDEMTFLIPKNELESKSNFGYEMQEFDITKEYLTLDIVENIQRLNK